MRVRGFTLIELMVAISIVAILSAIGLTLFTSVQKSARDAKRREELKSIVNALEQYKLANGVYPLSNDNWYCSTGGANWLAGLGGYFSSGNVPQDPQNTGPFWDTTKKKAYCYYSGPSYDSGAVGRWFMLVAPLENPNSADLATKCVAPNGTVFNYGTAYSLNSLMMCSQQ